MAPKSLLALSQKCDNLCNRCQYFTVNMLSYWIRYALSEHFVEEKDVNTFCGRN